jgi:hypothetical protein
LPAQRDRLKALAVIKVIVAIPKRPDISDAQFHAHWKGPHAALALNIRAMRRYVQAHRIPSSGLQFPTGPYSGFAEVWLDDLPTALGLGNDPDYQRYLVPDEPHFCDVKGLHFMFTEEEEVVSHSPPMLQVDHCFKIMQFVRRPAGMSSQSFRKTWGRHREEEANVRAMRAIRHVRCRVAVGTQPPSGSGYDAVRELWWPSAESFDNARLQNYGAWEHLMNSGVEDVTATLVITVEEIRFLWPRS